MPADSTTRRHGSMWLKLSQNVWLALQTFRMCLTVILAYIVFVSCIEVNFVTWVHDGQAWTFHLERGMLAIQRLEGWQRPQPKYPILTWKVIRPLEKLAPWKWAWTPSAHSWWEDVGYDFSRRGRLLGFEFASGIFWPPFVTQHPKVPFTLFSFPLWMAVPAMGYRPTQFLIRAVRQYRSKHQVAGR